MSGKISKEFLCSWRIKNYNFSCLFNFKSPVFTIGTLGENEWCLNLFVKHYSEGIFWKMLKSYIVCQLSLQKYFFVSQKDYVINEKIDLNFRFELTNVDGDFLRASKKTRQMFENGTYSEPCELIELEDLVKEMSNCPDDTLILRCYLLSNHENYSVLPINSLDPYCEIETTSHLHCVPFKWHFKFSNFENWSVTKNVCLTNIPLEITFKYIFDRIQVEISSNIKDHREHLFVCEITIFDSSDKLIVSNEHFKILLCNNKIWQYPNFISKEDLEKAGCFLLEEIRVNLRLTHAYSSTLSYYKDSKKNKTIKESVTVSEMSGFSHLQQDLHNLLLSKEFSDVKLRVDDEIFPAHKVLLAARSPVFSTIFKQDITFVDIFKTDKNTLESFLEYVYTCEIGEMNEELAINLLMLADKYQVLPLVEKCSVFLKSIMSLKNVCRILTVADEVNHEFLKSSAIDYVVENSMVLLSSPEWFKLIKINETLVPVILSKISNKLLKKEESTAGSLKEVHLPAAYSQKSELSAGSSKEVPKQSKASSSEILEPEGRQLKLYDEIN